MYSSLLWAVRDETTVNLLVVGSNPSSGDFYSLSRISNQIFHKKHPPFQPSKFGNYANFTQSTRINGNNRAPEPTRKIPPLLHRVPINHDIRKLEEHRIFPNTIINSLPTPPFGNKQLLGQKSTKSCQIIIKLRKKCVIFTKIIHLSPTLPLETEKDNGIVNPLFHFIPVFAILFSYISEVIYGNN